MKYYRKGRLETAHDQSRSAAFLTVGAWVALGLGFGLVPYPFIPVAVFTIFVFTIIISFFLMGLYAHVHPILWPSEKQKFMHFVWMSGLACLVLSFVGPQLSIAIPSVLNLIATLVFQSLQRT